MGTMTDKEYLDYGGNVCPICKKESVEAEGMDMDGDIGWSNARCIECGATWTDQWKMIGFSNLVKEETEV